MIIMKAWLIIFGLSSQFSYSMETIESFLGTAMVGLGVIMTCKGDKELKKLAREIEVLHKREAVNSSNLMRIVTSTEVDVALVGTRPFLLLDDFRETPAERLEGLRNLRVENNNFPLERTNLFKKFKSNERKRFGSLLVMGFGTILCLKNTILALKQVQTIDQSDRASLLLGIVCGLGIGLCGFKYVVDSINKDND